MSEGIKGAIVNRLHQHVEKLEDLLQAIVMTAWKESDFLHKATPASLGHHHAYSWGLLRHTLEVADDVAEITRPHDRNVLMASALLHDVAKVYDYEVKDYFTGQELPKRHLFVEKRADVTTVWRTTDYYKQIHHVQGSYGLFMVQAVKFGLKSDVMNAIGHAILAHHGPKVEWGSNVEPQTLEAVLLHQADYLSAHFGPSKDKLKL